MLLFINIHIFYFFIKLLLFKSYFSSKIKKNTYMLNVE